MAWWMGGEIGVVEVVEVSQYSGCGGGVATGWLRDAINLFQQCLHQTPDPRSTVH